MKLETMIELLGSLEKGQLAQNWCEELKAVANAVNELGGKGAVTLKLSVSAKEGLVEIRSDLKSSVPTAPRRSSHFWLDRDGEFTLQHPNQIDFFDPERARRTAEDAPVMDRADSNKYR